MTKMAVIYGKERWISLSAKIDFNHLFQLALTKKMQAKIKKIKAIKNNFLTFEKSGGVK